MLRLKQSGRFSDVITNMNSGNSQQKASSRSWMIKYGIRRYYNLTFASKCPDCGQALTRVYRRHPFVMPKQFGKGLWLTADCRCVRAEQKRCGSSWRELTSNRNSPCRCHRRLEIMLLLIFKLKVLTARLTASAASLLQILLK